MNFGFYLRANLRAFSRKEYADSFGMAMFVLLPFRPSQPNAGYGVLALG